MGWCILTIKGAHSDVLWGCLGLAAEVGMPFAGFVVDEVRQVCSLMRQHEKMPPRAVDAAVKNAKSSGIERISVLLAILIFCSSEKGAALNPQATSRNTATVFGRGRVLRGSYAPSYITRTTDGYIWVRTGARGRIYWMRIDQSKV